MNNREERINSVICNETVTEKTIPISVFKTDTNNGLQVDSFYNKDNEFNISMVNECVTKENKIIFNGTEDQIQASPKEGIFFSIFFYIWLCAIRTYASFFYLLKINSAIRFENCL